MVSLVIALIVIAFVLALFSVAGRVPLWASVFVLCVAELIEKWPQ